MTLSAVLAVVLGAGCGSHGRSGAGGAAGRDPCPRGTAVRVATRGRIGTMGSGSWSWFGDPRAVNVDAPYDETLAGWIDRKGRVTVAALDPACGVEQRYVVGHLFHDDHGTPAILIEPDHRVTVFWSGHDGAAMDYRTTVRPGDLSGWSPDRRIRSRLPGDLGFTYPNPVLLPGENNKLYLFLRGPDWSADYATRTAGDRWGAVRELIRSPGERPYVKVAGNGSNTIALAFTNGHPRNVMTSIYYVQYRDGWLRHADGRPIARLGSGPILPRQGDLVYNVAKTHVPSWVWDVAFDRSGHPVIVYATFPSVHKHAYWYARWSGSRWVSHFLTFAGPTISPGTIEREYSAGITLDHADPSIVYLSRKVHGAFEIERWVSTNGGSRWRHATVVRGAGIENIRPVVPRGSAPDTLSLLWLRGHYGSYTTYRTSIAYRR